MYCTYMVMAEKGASMSWKRKDLLFFSAEVYWPPEESATWRIHASMLEDAVNATKNNELVCCSDILPQLMSTLSIK